MIAVDTSPAQVELSILYLRCVIVVGASVGTKIVYLSILYLRCRRS